MSDHTNAAGLTYLFRKRQDHFGQAYSDHFGIYSSNTVFLWIL